MPSHAHLKISIYLISHNVISHMTDAWDSSTKIDYTYGAGQHGKIIAITYVAFSGERIRLEIGDTVESIYRRASMSSSLRVTTVKGTITNFGHIGQAPAIQIDTGTWVQLRNIIYVAAPAVPVAEDAVSVAEDTGGTAAAGAVSLSDDAKEINARRKLVEEQENRENWLRDKKNEPDLLTSSDNESSDDESPDVSRAQKVPSMSARRPSWKRIIFGTQEELNKLQLKY